jgi:hypothetical protein
MAAEQSESADIVFLLSCFVFQQYFVRLKELMIGVF